MIIPNAGKDTEKLDYPYISGGHFIIKLNIHTPYNPANILLGIYPRKKLRFILALKCVYKYSLKLYSSKPKAVVSPDNFQ